jgi:hypothetical protein
VRYVLALCATLLAAAGLVTSARANTVPVGGGSLPALRLFDVYLDDRHIGQHRYELAPQADGGLRLRSEARFELKLLGLTAYRYRHEAHELWREGCLAELRAETLDNGKPSRVQVQPREGCTMSYAYWDMRFLQQPRLLNPQTGLYDAVRVSEQGTEALRIGEREVRARRYQLVSDQLRIDLWYSPEGEWLQLHSTTRSGRLLRYRLQSDSPTS